MRARGLKFTATVLTIIAKVSQYLQVLGKKQVQNTETCHSVRKDAEEVLDQAIPPDPMAIYFTEDMKSSDEVNRAKAHHENHHQSNLQAWSVIGVELEQVLPLLLLPNPSEPSPASRECKNQHQEWPSSVGNPHLWTSFHGREGYSHLCSPRQHFLCFV